MQQCYSGASIPTLKDNNTIILTAANADMRANAMDELYFDDIDYPGDPDPGNQYWAFEREVYPNDPNSYRHGEFNFHLFNALKMLGPDNISVDDETSAGDFPFSNTDINNDNITSFNEAYEWITDYNSIMRYQWDPEIGEYWDDPQLSDSSDISSTTSIEYPTIVFNDVTSNLSVRGLIGISLNINVEAGYTLNIIENAVVDLLTDINITVDPGGTLVIGDNVTFNGEGGDNKIIINGSIQVGSNVTFDEIDEIQLNNSNLATSFSFTSFTNNTILKNASQSISINYCLFEECEAMYSLTSDVNISNTEFNNTSIVISNSEEIVTHSTTIQDCEFNNTAPNTVAAIKLMCCDEFLIESNTISGYDKGIDIWYSGEGTSGNQNVFENEISSTSNGILLYNTIGSVAGNNLYSNDIGVKFLCRSNVALMGDPISGVQFIIDNNSYEVYASEESFPWYFRYNEIVDDDNGGNPNDPLVYHNSTAPYPLPRDVEYNCWGDHFSANEDLYPVGGYDYIPVWCANKMIELITGEDEILYNSAIAEFEAGNYTQAKSIYYSLIEQFNESVFAQAAVKDLFPLEFFAGNDYNNLKTYYRSNDTILADTALAKISDYMANKCDITLENYQTAIDWFEEVILDPESFEDSIFAVIDLGYLYLQIDTTSLKSVIGNLNGYKPGSFEEFNENSYYLLSLLPGNKMDDESHASNRQSQPGKIISNTPNPFNDNTIVIFEAYQAGEIMFRICDYTGKVHENIHIGRKGKGISKIEITRRGLSQGIYFLSLCIDDQIVDTKKLCIL